jgi:hypothetical protein
MQQQNWRETSGNTTNSVLDTHLVAEGIVKSEYLENNAMIVIMAQNGERWSGAIIGSDDVKNHM